MNIQRILAAEVKFSPLEMMKHLKRGSDGVVYFDRAELVTSIEDCAQLQYVLNSRYNVGWDDVDNLTAYFEVYGNEIVGGGYNMRTKQKTSCRRLISTNEQAPLTAYTYTIEEINKMQQAIIYIAEAESK